MECNYKVPIYLNYISFYTKSSSTFLFYVIITHLMHTKIWRYVNYVYSYKYLGKGKGIYTLCTRFIIIININIGSQLKYIFTYKRKSLKSEKKKQNKNEWKTNKIQSCKHASKLFLLFCSLQRSLLKMKENKIKML